MFYLIGGPPRCGKTTLSKKLAKALNLPWISADTLEAMVWASTAKTDLKKKFPKAVMRSKTKNSNDIMYNRYSAQAIMTSYKVQAKTTWPAIEAMIKAETRAGHSYIVEGHQIHPRLVLKLVQQYGENHVKAVFLIKAEIDMIVEGAKKNRAKTDWFIQKTKEEDTYYKIAAMIRLYGKFFLQEAKKYGLPLFIMDHDFKSQLSSIVDFMKEN